MTEAAFDWRAYSEEIPFPDTNSAEAVADAAAGLNLYGKGGEDASSPLPRFRNHPDEVDYLMKLGRYQIVGEQAAWRVKDSGEWVSELSRDLDTLEPRTVRAVLGTVARLLHDASMVLTAFEEAKR